MKTIKLFSLVIMLLSLLCFSCSDEDSYNVTSTQEDPEVFEITGNSFLKVENDCVECADIYFDGKYIGKVGFACCNEWSVPEGQHFIKIYCQDKGLCGEVFEFKDGEVTNICMSNISIDMPVPLR